MTDSPAAPKTPSLVGRLFRAFSSETLNQPEQCPTPEQASGVSSESGDNMSALKANAKRKRHDSNHDTHLTRRPRLARGAGASSETTEPGVDRSVIKEEIRAELAAEWAALEAAKQAFDAEKRCHRRSKTGNIVKLNVGGRVFTTRRSTLTSQGGYLADVFGGRFVCSCQHIAFTDIVPRIPREVDDDGITFIDRDSEYFSEILSWLRDPMAPKSLKMTPKFHHELKFYGLEDRMLVGDDDPEGGSS